MPSEVLANRYAEALASAIDEMSDLEEVSAELLAVAEVVDHNAQFKIFLEGPNVREEDKHALMKKAFGGKLQSICMDFLTLLLDKHRIDHLAATAEAFARLVETRRNQVRVQVTTAFDMPVDMADRLKRALDASTGFDCILDSRVDASIVAGVVVKLGDRVIDGSVRAALADMRKNLLHASI